MANKVRSARGQIIDLDMVAIKQQMTNETPSIDVQSRQQFIEQRDRPRKANVAPGSGEWLTPSGQKVEAPVVTAQIKSAGEASLQESEMPAHDHGASSMTPRQRRAAAAPAKDSADE